MIKNENAIKIVVADDHEIFRDGFAGMLKKQPDIVLVGQAENGKQLLAVVDKTQPDVVLTDIKMPVMDGIAATQALTKKYPEMQIIALSMFNDDHYVLDMMEAGAKGYLLKNAHKNEIIDAIRTVNKNELYYCKETSLKLIHLMANRKIAEHTEEPVASFNAKEMEIINLICKESSNKDMSGELHLSVRTIEGYRKRIQEKMKVKNAVGIVVYAIRHKLVQL